MAELGFMESLALGYMAAGSGPDWGPTINGILNDRRYKRDLAQADTDYATLVTQYNRLVDGFDELFRLARGLEDQVALQGEHIKQLEGDLIAANERATAAEQRVTTLEQWGNGVAIREAEARRDATFYENQFRGIGDMATKDAIALRKATEEIACLEAIIAGMTKGEDRAPPASDSPTP